MKLSFSFSVSSWWPQQTLLRRHWRWPDASGRRRSASTPTSSPTTCPSCDLGHRPSASCTVPDMTCTRCVLGGRCLWVRHCRRAGASTWWCASTGCRTASLPRRRPRCSCGAPSHGSGKEAISWGSSLTHRPFGRLVWRTRCYESGQCHADVTACVHAWCRSKAAKVNSKGEEPPKIGGDLYKIEFKDDISKFKPFGKLRLLQHKNDTHDDTIAVSMQALHTSTACEKRRTELSILCISRRSSNWPARWTWKWWRSSTSSISTRTIRRATRPPWPN